jgi:hypothetical protein
VKENVLTHAWSTPQKKASKEENNCCKMSYICTCHSISIDLKNSIVVHISFFANKLKVGNEKNKWLKKKNDRNSIQSNSLVDAENLLCYV